MSELPFRARAFGQDWAADFPLNRFDAAQGRDAFTGFEIRKVAQLPVRDAIARKGRGEIYQEGFRFTWSNIVTFDVRTPRQVDYCPLDGWRGNMPDALYSTVTALTLAGAGFLPMHASAIEFDGRAFLFAGKGGAGKSTLTAELLANGARLLSDDLTVLIPPGDGHGFRVTRGRPSMRLHPATAHLVDAAVLEEVPDDARGKLLVTTDQRADDQAYPLGGIFLLRPGSTTAAPLEAITLLPPHIFRPRWMSLLPGNGQRRAWLLDMASTIPVRRLAEIVEFGADARHRRVAAAMAAMAAIAG